MIRTTRIQQDVNCKRTIFGTILLFNLSTQFVWRIKKKNTAGTVGWASVSTNQVAVNMARVLSSAYEFLRSISEGKAVGNLYRCIKLSDLCCIK